jgi:hypothetical protein
MAEHDWNPQTLNFAQEFAGAKGIKVGFKMPAIQTPEDLEAALLLPAQFENVAEKSDSQRGRSYIRSARTSMVVGRTSPAPRGRAANCTRL